ncbi:FMRFamide receptor [Sarcoptes scabiei]|uniref:FMRFamide receptor n=1 Tax=Sarcoptes scabiei TaxID=52283 RepID=A0A834RES2_SARSC|nr:FMRFamide receptor [Sarcoptes scabiei]
MNITILFRDDQQNQSGSIENIDLRSIVSIRDTVRFWVQKFFVPSIVFLGIIGNLITVIVMCHQRMRSTSTHIYLAALALFDSSYLLASFLLSLQHYSNLTETKIVSNENFEMLDLLRSIYWFSFPSLIVVCDFASNTSIWLTVMFTTERYMAINFPLTMKTFCTRSRAFKSILIIAIVCSILTLPTYFEYEIIIESHSEGQTIEIVESDLIKNPRYQIFYFWFTALMFTFIPLTLLTFLNVFLIKSVRRQSRKRNHLTRQITYATENSLIRSSVQINSMEQTFPIQTTKTNEKIKFRFFLRKNKNRSIRDQDSHITRLLIAVIENLERITLILLQIIGNVCNLLIAINAAVGDFMCIEREKLCDGQQDCPEGQDESLEQCSNNELDEDCYQCRNTNNQCISKQKICDEIFDCLEGDDEAFCMGKQSSNRMESNFVSNQYGTTNINIDNRDSGNVEIIPKWIENDRQSSSSSSSSISDIEENLSRSYEKSSPKSTNQNGIGFQFRVNNFIIYNSEVKMFNQDSDDLDGRERKNQANSFRNQRQQNPIESQ